MAEEFNNKQVFLKKLIYRSKYTGTKETDLLLGKFSDVHLPKLTFKELLAYEKLLSSGDLRIWRLSVNLDLTQSTLRITLVSFSFASQHSNSTSRKLKSFEYPTYPCF